MNIYVDIDDTICHYPQGNAALDYAQAQPIPSRISYINQLHDEGATITYWTARGTVSGIDWTQITKKQLESWGAKHHHLILGKPNYDIFIDDKAFNSDAYFSERLQHAEV